ncbi:hypothetical protein PV328_010801 [Microctonus aethiopoides]|uniref:Uncharacterized protein n=1 Tax=Microctonus aethiopoides TaxID=144406 RepID=A0AA39KQJ5_9HYME|nr:hypothetical protein PV328_010801 [Microctonus aethiopoides]
MERTSVNLRPEGYHRRRNSYISAIEENNAFILEPVDEIIRRPSIEIKKNKKLETVIKLNGETANYSECSSCIEKNYNNDTRTPLSISRISSLQEIERPEILCTCSEIKSNVIQYKLSMKNDVMPQCKCREDSLLSMKSSSSTVSAVRFQDSGYSLSTCQSLIIPSSRRNSVNQMIATNERRHSDVIYSRRYNNDQRKMSDQSVVKLYHCNDSKMTSLLTTASLPCSLLPKDNDKCSKLLDRNGTSSSFKHFSRNFTRQNSDASIKTFRKDSFDGSMTNRMMKRRFSEQLILEGGLTCEPEFQQLVEGDDDLEESLTGIIAKKKITLKSHYYPEGQWGHIIMIVAVIIQLICHGLQLASGVLLNSCATHFDKSISDSILDICNEYGKRIRDLDSVMSLVSISRALSWPLLNKTGNKCTDINVHDCARDENINVEDGRDNSSEKPQLQETNPNNQVAARKFLYRHYYPEGGWGWIIIFTGTLVHLIGSGVQLSAPANLALPANIKFHHHPLHTSGCQISLSHSRNANRIGLGRGARSQSPVTESLAVHE